MEKYKRQPLVSVAVVAYNSSRTIIETLDSIYNQIYRNIELIISDDCSTDGTVEVCKAWLKTHNERFVSIKFIIPNKNTGLSGNCQRVWEGCNTEWLKLIAADDLLLPNCISDNVEFVSKHDDAQCVFSKIKIIGMSQEDGERFLQMRYDYSFFQKTRDEQYEQLLKWCSIPAPASFLNVLELRKKGLCYDTRIPMIDDRPFFLRLVAAGVRFDFFDKITVGYRVHPNSLCNAPIHSPAFHESVLLTNFYYPFAYYYAIDSEKAIKEVVAREMTLYNEYYQLKQLTQSRVFKIVNYICNPRLICRKVSNAFRMKR